MNRLCASLAAVVLLSAGILACNSPASKESPPSPLASRTIAVSPGVAGSTEESVFSASATIFAIDASSRRITLIPVEGNAVSYKVGPDIQNLDQLHIGDKVHATFTENRVVFVRRDGPPPGAERPAGITPTPTGAKPGVIVAEAYELVATLKSLNMVQRTATLVFADGQIMTVSVRDDVDPTKYTTGDRVVIWVTQTLSNLAVTP